MRIRLRWVLLQVLLTVSCPSQAEVLSWSSAVEEVQRENLELKAAKDSLEASQYSIRTAQSAFYPQVSANLGYGYGTNKSDLLAKGPGIDPKSSYSAGLSVAQSIFTGGSDEARVAQARANATGSSLALETLKARLSAELKGAYANLLFAQRAVRLQEDISRRRQENLRLVELRFESGRENKGSVLQSEAYLAQSRLEALQAQNSLKVSQAQLLRLLGRSEGTEIRVADEVPSSKPPERPAFMELAKQAPEYKQAGIQIQLAQEALRLARAGYYPSLSLTGTLGRQDETFFPQRETWSVNLSLNYPLYNGGKDSSAMRSAQSTLGAASWTQQNLDKQLLARLQQSHATWLEAVERLRVDESFVKAAQVRADIARKKYDNGLTTFEDWDRIESELITRQRSVLASQRDRVTSEASWEQLQGKGVIP